MKLAALVSLFFLGLAPSATGQPSVERWGTLREVLRDGSTEARVLISELERPGAFGLGALEGLAGEVIVVDGEAWISRPLPTGGTASRRAVASDRATFAVVSVVDAWTEHVLSGALSVGELEQEVIRLAARHGLGDTTTFPFVVEGRFRDLEAHVLAGACPFASPEPLPDDLAPRQIQRPRARGVLVGFHSGEPPGVISHHGTRLHVHALLDGRGRPAGHVDAVTVLDGAVLRLPARVKNERSR